MKKTLVQWGPCPPVVSYDTKISFIQFFEQELKNIKFHFCYALRRTFNLDRIKHYLVNFAINIVYVKMVSILRD